MGEGGKIKAIYCYECKRRYIERGEKKCRLCKSIFIEKYTPNRCEHGTGVSHGSMDSLGQLREGNEREEEDSTDWTTPQAAFIINFINRIINGIQSRSGEEDEDVRVITLSSPLNIIPGELAELVGNESRRGNNQGRADRNPSRDSHSQHQREEESRNRNQERSNENRRARSEGSGREREENQGDQDDEPPRRRRRVPISGSIFSIGGRVNGDQNRGDDRSRTREIIRGDIGIYGINQPANLGSIFNVANNVLRPILTQYTVIPAIGRSNVSTSNTRRTESTEIDRINNANINRSESINESQTDSTNTDITNNTNANTTADREEESSNNRTSTSSGRTVWTIEEILNEPPRQARVELRDDIFTFNLGDYARTDDDFNNIVNTLYRYANDNAAPTPADKNVIENLPIKEYEGNGMTCVICKDKIEKGNDIIEIECHHSFHSECIIKWFEKSGTCPICRYDLGKKRVPDYTGAIDTNDTSTRSTE